MFLPCFGRLHPEGEEPVPEGMVGRQGLGADEPTEGFTLSQFRPLQHTCRNTHDDF